MYDFLYHNGIATLSFVLSALNSAYLLKTRRRKVKITINELKLFDSKYYINLVIENNSHLPITITDIQIKTESDTIKICKYKEYSDSIIIDVPNGNKIQEDSYTDGFPILLAPLEASFCRFKTKESNYTSKKLNIQKLLIFTTRGNFSIRINHNF